MALIVLLALAASVYLVYVLEIFKFKGLRASQMRKLRPGRPPSTRSASRAARRRDRRVRAGGLAGRPTHSIQQRAALDRADRGCEAGCVLERRRDRGVIVDRAAVTRYAHGVSRIVAFVSPTLALAGAGVDRVDRDRAGRAVASDRRSPVCCRRRSANLPEFFVVMFALQAAR